MRIPFFVFLLCLIHLHHPYVASAQSLLNAGEASAGYLLVADKDQDTLYFINGETLEVEDSVAVGRGPHDRGQQNHREPRVAVPRHGGGEARGGRRHLRRQDEPRRVRHGLVD